MVDIKRNEKSERATTDNKKAMKSSKKLRRGTKSNNEHRSWKNKKGQEKTKTQRHKMSKWKPGFNRNEEVQTAVASPVPVRNGVI